MDIFYGLVGGIVLLVAGGYAVIHGSVTVARMLGWSEFFIGVVLIGFGTSSPELFASVGAAWHGSAGLAFGNVVGSNISNLLFILAMTAIIAPVAVSESVAKRDAPILLGMTAIFVLISFVFPLERFTALVYLVIVGLYVYVSHQDGKANPSVEVVEKTSYSKEKIFINLGIALFGVALLVYGADLLIGAASTLARSMGVSETVIGLTIVAVGTSLPELVSTLGAAYKGKHELALGNIIGSNVYNLFGILGVAGLVAPTDVPTDIRLIHNPAMLIATAAAVYVMHTKRVISRQSGLYMIGGYVLYVIISYLIS